jgi:metallo-beta-lactamase class B
MRHRHVLCALHALALTGLAAAATAQQNPQWREWNRPVEPVRIAGSLYYVGMANVSALLIATPEGHVLLDGAFRESAEAILDNVRKLGFKPRDVKILLSSHAHADHAGGLAEIKAQTGARLYAGAADVAQLESGGRGDFAWGDDLLFPPVKVDTAVRDGDVVKLGGVKIRAVATPGHTKGCTSWAFTVDDGGAPRRVLFAGGTTAPGYELVSNDKYPAIVPDFERTFATLRREPADIYLEGHGFAFGLDEKRAGRRSFVDPDGRRARLDEIERAFRESLEKQRAEAKGGSPGQ